MTLRDKVAQMLLPSFRTRKGENDAARFPEADAVLLTYWSSAMRELPKEGSSWSVNLPAGLLACFGVYSAEGRLPVSIPALNESYGYTADILYPRGYSANER